jgi:hypothetical protein
MEERVIELTSIHTGEHCVICNDVASVKCNVNGVVSFNLCDRCLSKAQQDIQKIRE